MEDKSKEELLAELAVVETMIKENPCGLRVNIFEALKDVVKTFIGTHCVQGATREQVAKYFGRDVRTISHWKEKYDDFPEPQKNFAQNKTYNWMDIIKWKIDHKGLFEDK